MQQRFLVRQNSAQIAHVKFPDLGGVKSKRCRPVATRDNKLAATNLAFIPLASIRILGYLLTSPHPGSPRAPANHVPE
jgi:hypothetical protein